VAWRAGKTVELSGEGGSSDREVVPEGCSGITGELGIEALAKELIGDRVPVQSRFLLSEHGVLSIYVDSTAS